MKCEKIRISTPWIRLDSFLKFTGAAQTGGHAKILISEELVKVDGEICGMRGKKLYPGARVEIEGRAFEVEATAGD